MQFKANQVVRTHGLLARVSSGPYTGYDGRFFYVLEAPEGHHIIRDEEEMSPVVE